MADKINELSKKTIGSYVHKATSSLADRSLASGTDYATDHDIDTAKKRQKGLNMVAKKLTREDQVNELSASTLGSYIKKAHVSGTAAAAGAENAYRRKPPRPVIGPSVDSKARRDMLKHNRDGENRETGIKRATNKLVNKVNEDEQVMENQVKIREIVECIYKGKLNGLSEEVYIILSDIARDIMESMKVQIAKGLFNEGAEKKS